MIDTRHTYATMCLMWGMNPAFNAAPFERSVQVLLSAQAQWISTSGNWAELEMLDLLQSGTKTVQARTQ